VIAACCLPAAAAGLLPVSAQPALPDVRDNPLAALSLQQLSATRDRPLFSPTRRGRAAAPVAIIDRPAPVVVPEAAPPALELYGTVVDAEHATAIILLSSTSETRRVHIGDEVVGWKVTQIDDRKLVLSLDQRTAVFSMFKAKRPNETPASQ
jgi:general secretion pathway protein N